MELTKKQEKKILVKFIETLVLFGHDISEYIQKPCSYFDMEAVLNCIVELHEEHGNFNEYGELNSELKNEFVSDLAREFGKFNINQ